MQDTVRWYRQLIPRFHAEAAQRQKGYTIANRTCLGQMILIEIKATVFYRGELRLRKIDQLDRRCFFNSGGDREGIGRFTPLYI